MEVESGRGREGRARGKEITDEKRGRDGGRDRKRN